MRLPITPQLSTKDGISNKNARLTNTLKETAAQGEFATVRPGLVTAATSTGNGNGIVCFNGELVSVYGATLGAGQTESVGELTTEASWETAGDWPDGRGYSCNGVIFLLASEEQFYYSSDGVNFYTVHVSAINASYITAYNISYGNGQYVLFGAVSGGISSYIATSADLIVWTERVNTLIQGTSGIAYANGSWWIGDGNSIKNYSSTWAYLGSFSTGLFYPHYLTTLGNYVYSVNGYAGAGGVYTGIIRWSTLSDMAFVSTVETLLLLTLSGARLIANSGADNVCLSSTDGVTWESHSTPFTGLGVNGYAYCAGNWIAYYTDISDSSLHLRVATSLDTFSSGTDYDITGPSGLDVYLTGRFLPVLDNVFVVTAEDTDLGCGLIQSFTLGDGLPYIPSIAPVANAKYDFAQSPL